MKIAECPLFIFLAISVFRPAVAAQNLSIQASTNVSRVHFLGPQTLLAKGDTVYAASDAALHVISGNVLQSQSRYLFFYETPTAATWCDSVDSTFCVTTGSGRVYRLATSTSGLALVSPSTIRIATYPLASIAHVGTAAYAGVGQASVAATSDFVLTSGLNPSDYAQEITNPFGWPMLGMSYGKDGFIPNVTRVFDRHSGLQVTTWDNPRDVNGNESAVAIFTSPDGKLAATTSPGCCGPGITLYDLTSSPPQRIAFINWAYMDSVCFAGQYMFAGSEASFVNVWSLADPANPGYVTGIFLRDSLGASQVDAAEVRSLACAPAGSGFVIYAGTSSTYGVRYPNLFKLTFTPNVP